jgi:hypothetical protein
MSKPHVPAALRRLVVARAEGICEYCLISLDDTFYTPAVDHILSKKHGGRTDAENLALCCLSCNQAKGTDLGSIDEESEDLVRFFHPRTDRWSDHFRIEGEKILGITPRGKATSRILKFNSREQRRARRVLIEANAYPTAAAKLRMRRQP